MMFMATNNDAVYSQKFYLLALKGQITVEYLDGQTLVGEFVTQDALNIFIAVDNTPLLIPRSQIRTIKGRPGQNIEKDDAQPIQRLATLISAPAAEISEPKDDDTLDFDIDTLNETDRTIVLPEKDLETAEPGVAESPSALFDVDFSPPYGAGFDNDDEDEDSTLVILPEEPEIEAESEMTYILSQTDGGDTSAATGVDTSADTGADTHEVAAYLDCITGPHAGEVFKLMPGITTIGRSTDNVLALAKDKEISRKHTKITYEGGQFVVEDQGSLNGSFVNNQRIEGPRYLDEGDVLMVGVSTLIYHRQ
jgi:hypothetical protein